MAALTLRAEWTIGGRYAIRCPLCKGRHTVEPRPGDRKLFCQLSGPVAVLILPPVAPRPAPVSEARREG